jgi:hypothetical protein
MIQLHFKKIDTQTITNEVTSKLSIIFIVEVEF